MNSKYRALGVVNATPNSFSDSHKNLNLEFQRLQLNSFVKDSDTVIDLGCESTAPFNGPVDLEEELRRLDEYMTNHQEALLDIKEISIDTYKIEVIKYFLDNYSSTFNTVIWNDISGDLNGVSELLNKYSSLEYVYCHNLSPVREQASNHMDFCQDSIDLKQYFCDAHTLLSSQGVDMSRVYFDPCFGFSKSAEQNIELIGEIQEYISCHKRWVLGVSRKSFLQNFSNAREKAKRIEDSEFIHAHILCKWMGQLEGKEVLFRVHSIDLFKTCLSFSKK